VVLRTILRIICNEWLAIVAKIEQLTRDECSNMISIIDVGIYMFEFNHKLGEYLRENDEMMGGFLKVIQ